MRRRLLSRCQWGITVGVLGEGAEPGVTLVSAGVLEGGHQGRGAVVTAVAEGAAGRAALERCFWSGC